MKDLGLTRAQETAIPLLFRKAELQIWYRFNVIYRPDFLDEWRQ